MLNVLTKYFIWFLFCYELDIQKLWRSVAVDGVDERNIEEYLQRHSIVTMQDHVMKKVISLHVQCITSGINIIRQA